MNPMNSLFNGENAFLVTGFGFRVSGWFEVCPPTYGARMKVADFDTLFNSH